MMLKLQQQSHRLSLYFYVPQVIIVLMLVLVNSGAPCSYNIVLYAGFRIAVDALFVICSYILDTRLTAWYELNGGWEATPDTAQRMLWKETVVSNFGVTSLSTGKATLLFYDMEFESGVSVFTSAIVAPAVAIMNITAIVLAFTWYCLPCQKTFLRNYILFLSFVYMVTLAYHLGSLLFRLVLCCAYFNCFWCCKRCLKATATYFDTGLPNPVLHFSVKHFILRESLATTIAKDREKRRQESDALKRKIEKLELRIKRKKQALANLHRLDMQELKAQEAIKNVIGLTDRIFREDEAEDVQRNKGPSENPGDIEPLHELRPSNLHPLENIKEEKKSTVPSKSRAGDVKTQGDEKIRSDRLVPMPTPTDDVINNIYIQQP
ncbi:hypothetical protein AAMO2058_000151400 [Amorphochlora amoebiformis]